MKKTVLLIFALSLAFGLQAQTHKVKIIRDDRIVTKNGRTTAECSQPLNNVRIYFPYTPATVSTDGNGLAPVPKDGKKSSYEIKQIRCQDYFLPDSLNIYNKPYAYETGKVNTIRMVSKQRYEDGIKKRTARLEKQIQEFRKRQQQDNAKFQQYEDSIATLNKMIDNVPKYILEILTTDFSNYTEEELKMQQLFDEGDYDAITANADKVNRQIDLVETAQLKIDSAKQSLFVTLPIMAESYANKLNFDSATYYYTKAADMFDTNFQAQIEAGSSLKAFACNYDLALKYYNRALHIAEKNNDSIDIATSYFYISIGHFDKCEYDRAFECYIKYYLIQKANLGEQHIDMADSYNTMGNIYRYKGEYDKALEFYNRVLEIWKVNSGKCHISIVDVYNNISSVYRYKGEYDKAMKYHNKAREIGKPTYERKIIFAVFDYEQKGNNYYFKGEYSKALDCHNKALTILKVKLGEEHIDVATSYNNLGKIYHAKRDYNKALEYYNKALTIQKAKLGEEHTDVAQSYNNLGRIYSDKGDYDKALEYYNKALTTMKSKLGEEHTGVANSYDNIGSVYYDKGDYVMALEYFDKTLSIYLSKGHEADKKIFLLYESKALCYSELGDTVKANKYWKKAEEIERRLK